LFDYGIADIYVMGHNHQRGAVPVSSLIRHGYKSYDKAVSELKMKQKRQWLIRSGAFKKSYQPNTSSYEISRLFRPSDLGAVKVIIGIDRQGDVFNADIDVML
jgi:hypothetical protein